MYPIYRFQINRPTVNLLDPETFVTGYRINENTGELLATSAYKTSDYISITPGGVYGTRYKDNTIFQMQYFALYDENKTFISGYASISQVVAPSNAAYARLSLPTIQEAKDWYFGIITNNYSAYVSPRVYPIYDNSLAINFDLESGQEFFRRKLSGNLTFAGADYNWICSQVFDFEFKLEILISYDRGQSWSSYWSGKFYKTDCLFNADDKTVSVSPTLDDEYNAVLNGLEKEYDLISLAPEIRPVKIDKRAMIQVYVPGESVVGCFLSGMWWEQECEPETDTNKLVNTYSFAFNKARRVVDVTPSGNQQLPPAFDGAVPASEADQQDFVNGEYKYQFIRYEQSGGSANYYQIVRVLDNTIMWMGAETNVPAPVYPKTITLNAQQGTGATGTVELYIHDVNIYARYVCDVMDINGVPTSPLPENDIVENNRNYSRVVGYNFPTTIYFSSRFSPTPTEWGLYQPGKYYQTPYVPGGGEFFPVARNSWGAISIWFAFFVFDWIVEEKARAEYTLRHAYPISSVISVLLSQIAPGVTHAETTDYSQFLYGPNPISGVSQTLFFTPKSNIVMSGYDQPAQKAMITLSDVTNMLRDCFRCYWFIDDQKRFRVEHIQYFRNGGSYSSIPSVGTNITKMKVARSGKSWATSQNKYKYDKPEMASRYQFGWMDDVTTLFEGYPIDILSKYVTGEKIEQITLNKITSDVDYILLNPSDISKDGFVLLGAVLVNGEYKLPYINFLVNNSDHYLQNAFVAFVFLQGYYFYDMPAPVFKINGVQGIAYGVKRLKTQDVLFPCLADPDVMQLVKTELGNGMFRKLSVNLSSRTASATIKYDIEQ